MDASRKRRLTGTVLVGVMWLLVLMMAILAVGAQNSRLDTRTSLSSVEKIRARWICRAGAETALAYLKDDLKDVDSLLDEWAISNDDLQQVQLTNGFYTVTITDECSRLNLNTATANQLLNLDTQTMNETVADSILDWRDTDETVRTSGAESGYYLNLAAGYSCRNGNFRTPREILRVQGVTEDLFFGSGNRVYGKGGWSRYLSCASAVNNVSAAGDARVNVNSASESDLTSKLSITSAQAQYIVQNRPFQNLAGLVGIRTTTTSSSSSQNTGGTSGNENTSGSQNTSGQNNTSGGGRGNSQMNQSSPRTLNIPIQAPFPIQWPRFSTVAAQLAGQTEAPPPSPGGGPGEDGQGGPPPGSEGGGRGQGGRGGRGGRQGPGQGQQAGQGNEGGPRGGPGGRQGGGRGREGGGGPGGPGGRRGTGQGRVRGGFTGGGGRQQGAAQAQPLDWTTFSRIFDQITLTDNKTIAGVININTVSLEVLRAFLEGDDDLAGKMIAYRESMGGEITNVCDLINVQGMTQQTLAKYLDQFSVRSSVFSIRVTAKSSACGVQYFMEEIVNRDREGREVLYKLEGVGI